MCLQTLKAELEEARKNFLKSMDDSDKVVFTYVAADTVISTLKYVKNTSEQAFVTKL